MTRKFTLDEVRDFLFCEGYVLISTEYFGVDVPLKIECNKGHIINLRLGDFNRGHRCSICFNEIRGNFTRYSIEKINKILIDSNEKDIIISKNYINNSQKLLVECHKCGNIYESSWNKLKSGYRHDSCSKKEGRRKQLEKIITGEYNLLYLFSKICEEWDYFKNKYSPEHYTPYSGQKVYWICSDCGHGWKSVIENRTVSGNGCPLCSSSKGEKLIKNFLSENTIGHIREFTFPNCKNKRELPFDFYLPDYNLCIEYDGEFHYEDVFEDPEEFKKVKNRDKIKTKYCKNNNIYLLRIPYWEFDNINEILERTLL